MHPHEPTTSLHWQRLHQQHELNPLSEGDYEEWRNNPVTLRLFHFLEYEAFKAQTVLSETVPDHPAMLKRHAAAYSCTAILEEIFKWSGEGIDMETEEEQ